jgi:hypothetical protein
VTAQLEDVISSWIAASRERHFDIIIAGRTFGGRHGEAMQTPVAYQIVGAILVVRFMGAERLAVSDPSGPSIGHDGELVIRDGSEARFSWFYYGRPQLPQNLCEDVYQKLGKGIVFTRIGPLFPTTVSFLYAGDEFVKLL